MKLLTSAPKGTQDILPADAHRWSHVERTAMEVAERYGFLDLRTPTFEHTELFVRSVGDTTDVVQKEMYTFLDKKDRSVTLRPEGTAGILRAAIENGLLGGQLPLKVAYLTNCFRYEKPQAGRLREFHQFGVESLGAASPLADAEVISLAARVLRELGASQIRLNINSIGCRGCRPEYHKKLIAYLEAHRETLCETCLQRMETNPLRILDCKNTQCKQVRADAPKMLGHICPDCRAHFEELQALLKEMGLAFDIDLEIVRGLDYYVRTVFEFVTDAIGAQGTVCGGGRYDGLVESLGGPALPGVGFAMGLERILLVLDACKAEFPSPRRCALYIAPMGEAAAVRAAALVERLRALGVPCDFDSMGRSLKAQMRYADKLGALYTVVLGDNELQTGEATLKEMQTGGTQTVSIADANALAALLLKGD